MDVPDPMADAICAKQRAAWKRRGMTGSFKIAKRISDNPIPEIPPRKIEALREHIEIHKANRSHYLAAARMFEKEVRKLRRELRMLTKKGVKS